MEITLKRISNGWIINITSSTEAVQGYASFPIEHFEPTFDKAVAFIKETTGEK